jgi:hypothetical protein
MKNGVINFSLSLFSLLFTLLVLEVGLRVYVGEYTFHNVLEVKRDLFRAAYPSEFDTELGWVPKVGTHKENAWNTRVTILDSGIRSNGREADTTNGQVVLAIGDSFTFGDQVSNDQTWPAILEDTGEVTVINGGVFGYGIDQSYLRMLTLADQYQPDIIVFSFIPDDIYRCELSERTSVPKPYFVVSGNNELELKNDHIPASFPSESTLDGFRQIAGYSFLAHKLALRVAPEYWLQGSWRSTRVHSDGTKVACLIFRQLAEYAQQRDIKIYVLIQYDLDGFEGDLSEVDEALTCIDPNQIYVIDLRASLAELKESNFHKYKRFYYGEYGHMTKAGNAFVASSVRKAIDSNK